MNCPCGKKATHLHPSTLCDACWARKYSTQSYRGEVVPFRKLFKDQLLKEGLFKAVDETNEAWYNRCKDEAMKSNMFKRK
jgi:hypothetical protein